MDPSNSADSMPRINIKDPRTWPPCACGEKAVGVSQIDRPIMDSSTGVGEDRIGDYSDVKDTAVRYFAVCQGCREAGDLIDGIVRHNAGFWELVRKDLGER